ncbi:MAG TPA: hypothetical protein VE871_08805 [Longimicrobium sp.]|nr:hypothetical protein [Longimicrobium sp.]
MHRLLLLALVLAACARGSVPADAAPAGADGAAPEDTLRGTVRITGSEPAVTYVVEDASGRQTALDGDPAVLVRLNGLEVAFGGEARGTAPFRVTRTEVRAVEGVPAVDGVLARDDGRDVLLARDGTRHVIARLPAGLRGAAGSRVWLAGPLDGDIDSFGIIVDRR